MGAWERIALTDEQVDERGITPMFKKDGRDGEIRKAWELQALGQATLVAMLRDELDARLPESLASVRERERQQRRAIAEFLATWEGA